MEEQLPILSATPLFQAHRLPCEICRLQVGRFYRGYALIDIEKPLYFTGLWATHEQIIIFASVEPIVAQAVIEFIVALLAKQDGPFQSRRSTCRCRLFPTRCFLGHDF
jgi:hypothetical protein